MLKNKYIAVPYLLIIAIILICFSLSAEVPMISSFETKQDFSNWELTDSTIDLTKSFDYATDGFFGARFYTPAFYKEYQQPGLLLRVADILEITNDWTAFNALLFDYYNPGNTEQEIIIKINDLYENNLVMEKTLLPGEGTVVVPLEGVERSQIKTLLLYFTKPGVIDVIFDFFRLENNPDIHLKPLDKSKLVLKQQISSFEKQSDILKWGINGETRIELSHDFATNGQSSLFVEIDKFERDSFEYPGFNLSKGSGLPSNWSRFNTLFFDYYNPISQNIPLIFEIRDGRGGRGFYSALLKPGKGLGKVSFGQIDTTNIASMYIYSFKPAHDYRFYIDFMRMEYKKGIGLKGIGYVESNFSYIPGDEFKLANTIAVDPYYYYGTGVVWQFRPVLYSTINFGSKQPIPASWKYNIAIDPMVIALQGSLYPNWQPIRLTLGKWPFSYSPYIATFNQPNAKEASGIMFDELKLLNSNVSGFLLWEALWSSSQNYTSLAEGIRMKFNQNSISGDLQLVRHLQNDSLVVENDKVKEFGKYIPAETDIYVNLEKKFSRGGNFSFIDVNQKLHNQNDKTYSARKVDLEVPIRNTKLYLSYRDFDPDFAPRYQLLTGKLSTSWEDGSLLGIEAASPVVRYKGQKGGLFKIESSFSKYDVALKLDRFFIQDKDRSEQLELNLVLSNKVRSYEFILVDQEAIDGLSLMELSIKQQVHSSSANTVNFNIGYTADKAGLFNDLEYGGSIFTVGIDNKFKIGFLKDLDLATGIEVANKPSYYIRGNWKLMGGLIRVSLALRNPAANKNEDWVDDIGRIHRRNNYLNLRTKVSF